MPWTSKDVDRFKKGLSDEQKKKWTRTANAALKSCTADGGNVLDCEVNAVRIANAKLSSMDAMSLSESPNPLNPATHSDGESIHLALIEASEEEDEYQLAFPIGLFKTGKYGEVIVTKSFVDAMVTNWKDKVLGSRNVFMDTGHNFEEANAWANDIRVSDDGIEIKWDFTDRGKELISSKTYKYYSAAIGWGNNIDTGDEVFPVLIAVSLTNMPVMNNMPAAHLEEHQAWGTGSGLGTSNTIAITQDSDSTHSDGEINIGGYDMTLTEIVLALMAAAKKETPTPEQIVGVTQALGIDNNSADVIRLTTEVSNLTESNKVLLDENKVLSDTVEASKQATHESHKKDVIEAALTGGKILPKNRDKWESMFDKDPESITVLLKEKGKEVELGSTGTGAGGSEAAPVDRAAFEIFHKIHPEMGEDEALKEFVMYGGKN